MFRFRNNDTGDEYIGIGLMNHKWVGSSEFDEYRHFIRMKYNRTIEISHNVFVANGTITMYLDTIKQINIDYDYKDYPFPLVIAFNTKQSKLTYIADGDDVFNSSSYTVIPESEDMKEEKPISRINTVLDYVVDYILSVYKNISKIIIIINSNDSLLLQQIKDYGKMQYKTSCINNDQVTVFLEHDAVSIIFSQYTSVPNSVFPNAKIKIYDMDENLKVDMRYNI